VSNYKPILCLDFDGVLHSYSTGWKGATEIPDPPTDGAMEWLKELLEEDYFDVQIYSSRSRYEGGIQAMRKWLIDNFEAVGISDGKAYKLKFPTEKPPAFLQIDDRCICFNGEFPTFEEMKNFKPWNKRGI